MKNNSLNSGIVTKMQEVLRMIYLILMVYHLFVNIVYLILMLYHFLLYHTVFIVFTC